MNVKDIYGTKASGKEVMLGESINYAAATALSTGFNYILFNHRVYAITRNCECWDTHLGVFTETTEHILFPQGKYDESK